MTLRLEVISDHKRLLGSDCECSFGPDGGTIGRSLQSDWILPDSERYISGSHATIDYQAGAYYLADISSNGVYVNHDNEPLGQGNPRRLFNGDHLRMGNFEIRVHLDEGEDLELPPEPKPTVVPDHIEQLVPVDDLNSSIMLIDEEEIAGNDLFSDAFPLTANAPLEPQTDAPATPDRAFESPSSAVEKSTAMREQPDRTQDAMLRSFLEAAGIDPDDIHPSVDPEEVMRNAGEVLNELVSGISELLVARSNVKSMFRLDQTTILPRHNNPLKLSTSIADSLKQLLVGREGEYLGPLDSVRDACRDLKVHHDAVIAAMIKAFGEFADRFDPAELEDHFRNTLERKPLFEGLAKRKYWELYCDLYPVLTQAGAASVPQQFSEDFVRHYEKRVADYKRIERTLGDTQKLVTNSVTSRRNIEDAEPLEAQVDRLDADSDLELDDEAQDLQQQAN